MSSICSDFHPVPTIVGDNIKGIVPFFFFSKFFFKKKTPLKKFACPGSGRDKAEEEECENGGNFGSVTSSLFFFSSSIQ